jgi:hypothetical protein
MSAQGWRFSGRVGAASVPATACEGRSVLVLAVISVLIRIITGRRIA